MTNIFQEKSFLKEIDFTKEELLYLIDFAAHLKALKQKNIPHKYLAGKNIALLFEKTSTRTRAAFTTATIDLGAHPEYLGKNDIQLGKKESVEDTAKVLGSMFDGIEYRGFSQKAVEDLSKYSGVPVWNGLTDKWHPTQMLADFLTIKEHFGKLEGLTLAYVGDGRNNVANSLLITSAILGVNISIVTPKSLFPESDLIVMAEKYAEASQSKVFITDDIDQGVAQADIIYTDVWVSMGEESAFKERIDLLLPYQVNQELMLKTKKAETVFLHCLPAFHDLETEVAEEIKEKYGLVEMEVTDEVFRSERALQFQQAENRMHTIKAVMAATLGNLFIPKV
ncbi:ornithine carbamoyltransferase [Enterococcus raffinosus]|uniref:Ornithine carbamoyltransferase n=1 Tax=Enterococcus raffinosus TaxID=71452 RepID=A0AAP5NFF2_9ENTE|nr:ornithine carbamoyltransferase [Enterococcus raffinosus]MDT2522351.1 ornithine carbamoyltransferase [Enterococcus raffinosus]MDT2531515.1 ornithine carbamoyltransferase [Enterococcus raffinosus]MDT2533733.1 ornithine carbamoyltransferase [Enterococcus raffinosus]MDT2543035.1 ornithine carbamoyltransferase [Enterococcus raffinosus]MDT2553270.1 ornithine carbamoyltransferase [Enterococcus raffinosus]